MDKKPVEPSIPTTADITQMRLARCGKKTEDLYSKLFGTPKK